MHLSHWQAVRQHKHAARVRRSESEDDKKAGNPIGAHHSERTSEHSDDRVYELNHEGLNKSGQIESL